MTDGLDLTVDTKPIDDLVKKFPQFEKDILDVVEIAMKNAVNVLHEQVTGKTPVNFGALRSSILPNVTRSGNEITGSVGTAIVYGFAVEYGRKAGSMPPVEVDGLELWVRRKLGISGNQARQVAYAIALTIQRKGTKGAFMFREGLKAATPGINRLFENVPDQAIAKFEKRL